MIKFKKSRFGTGLTVLYNENDEVIGEITALKKVKDGNRFFCKVNGFLWAHNLPANSGITGRSVKTFKDALHFADALYHNQHLKTLYQDGIAKLQADFQAVIDAYASEAVKYVAPKQEKATVEKIDRVGERWTPEEDVQLKQEYAAGASLFQLAKSHKRNFGGITARLKHLALVDWDLSAYQAKVEEAKQEAAQEIVQLNKLIVQE